jgi:enamine deaminase RidA (YjgF/YER057c/UK114 family)
MTPRADPVGIRSPHAYKAAMEERIKFSAAVRAGGFVFVSGVTGRDQEGNVIEDAEGQLRALFEEIGRTLEAAGSSWAHVVEMTSYTQGGRPPEERALLSEIRKEFVSEPYPAWTSVEVARLNAPGILVEIKVIAVVAPG